jgi:uncharacterized membrane protein YfcA
MMDPLLIVALLAMGVFGGFAAGLLGIGGGMVLVPFMTMVLTARGFAPHLIIHMSIATALATILFTSLSSMRAHHRHGAVLWPVVKLFVPGILLGSWVGPWIARGIEAGTLALLFAAFVAFSATQMLRPKKPAGARQLPGPLGMAAVGAGIGLMSGLFGAGGGFISVPFMTWCNVRIHNALATSAALGFPIALAGTLSNIYQGWNAPGLPPLALGFVYVPALVVIAGASVLCAPLGARTAHRMPVHRLQRIFALVLYALAAYMLWKGLQYR